jgi:hypothetical protein
VEWEHQQLPQVKYPDYGTYDYVKEWEKNRLPSVKTKATVKKK